MAWPGLNSKGGRLDPGQGQLEDGSFNQVINEADELVKRKGFVRGIEERFDGVVCGLFRYTDDCGAEYVIVADQTSIKVRTPFSIPEFLGSDSLPIDDFDTLNTSRWSNTDDYQVTLGELSLVTIAATGSDDFVPASRLMQWFKDSVLSSYYVEIEYAMEVGEAKQVVAAVVKRSDDGNTYLIANVVLDGSTYKVLLQLVLNGVRSTIAQSTLGGAGLADGFLRVSYDAGTFTATVRVIPSGGTQVTISKVITELQDAALGQKSAIGIVHAVNYADAHILSVSGGRP